MAIFSINGAILNAAYSLSAEIDKAYNLDGLEVFSQGYSISNVKSYFRSDTLSVANAINSLNDNWVSVVFIADPHGNANKKNSQAIALYLLANTKAKMLVLNGDYCDNFWSKTEYDSWMRPLVTSSYVDKIYATFGNHETFGDGATAEAKNSIYQDFLSTKLNLIGNPQETYYYFDDSQNRIRYMFLNTSEISNLAMTSEQVAWIGEKTQLPNSNWSLVVFGHLPIDGMNGLFQQISNKSTEIKNALDNCNGTVVGYFCGHEHIDAIYDVGSFWETTLYCDRFENTNYIPGYSITDRVAGTTSEQAVSVISFNTTTRQVVVRRIGTGRQAQISYDY